MRDWEPVTIGCSDTLVRRSPDGHRFAKTASTPSTVAELTDERDRLVWLGTTQINAPDVLDWDERDGHSTLVTSALPGLRASALPRADAHTAAQRLVEFLGFLHAIPVRDCPFDRRLAVTVPLATANVANGLVDEGGFDEVRRGQTAARLLGQLQADHHRAAALERADLAICHGDFCLPNVLLDPETLTVTGIVDVGRLGLADRHLDLALLTHSLASTDLNPAYGPELAGWVARRADADPWRIEYYRLLDEFF